MVLRSVLRYLALKQQAQVYRSSITNNFNFDTGRDADQSEEEEPKEKLADKLKLEARQTKTSRPASARKTTGKVFRHMCDV